MAKVKAAGSQTGDLMHGITKIKVFKESGLVVGSSFRDMKGDDIGDWYGNTIIGQDSATTSDWLFIKGPIQGAYIVTTDDSKGITDFGFLLDDPCKTVSNNELETVLGS